MAKTDKSASAPAPEESEAGAAGARMSTAPAEDRGQAMPGSFGGVRAPGALGWLAWSAREATGWVRWFWRQLTSMRVALLLLFLLSLATIPGSLVPQTGVDQLKAEQWQKEHETLAPLYEKLGLFHVYSSVWFSAIYILLFVSLIGCIIPRTWQFVGQLRGRPPAAPRHLDRMPAHATWRTSAEPEQVLAAAGRILKRRRFRTETAADSVGGEKGYLREAGNLLFHISLIVLLVAFASGQLWKSEGGKLVVEGDGFANNLTQYDDFKAGSLFDADDLDPFDFDLDSFSGSYERTGPQKGTPRDYAAHVTYRDKPGAERRKATIKVNEPLETTRSKVYLIGHGYAPMVTVRDGKGDIAFKGPIPSLPLDSNVTETSVLKVADYRDKDGKPDDLGFQGNFVPTLDLRTGTMFSQFPALDNPRLVLTAYRGSLGVDSGVPQSVYQLDTTKMKQFKNPDGRAFAQAMKVGDTMTLPDGAGTLHFDGIRQWATFQVSQKPGNGAALAGAVAALVGLAGSLFIQRRRVWVRAVRGADGTTVVELAGLGRSESARLPEELADLAAALQPDAPQVAGDATGDAEGDDSGAAAPDAPADDAREGASPAPEAPAETSEGARA
ncbi:cytochrome c biogenesis protein ResB [Streptomyces triculaminicus]|uniref:Cytochrome c biogenesis protein ResB n=2 Tax=Streptomyces TaxID=1883 RepID=A0A939JQ27_9ACTN|nr:MULTISPECIES: cytochrome c biogenesis protein ResB [Streptomyces]MBO0652124.1 cytochrome c biogenesis protein ResB [Streptomyces triculaminicus]QSY46986.1 cytochrome c biogenesis protein ResB [Streptomyces griseocarneus]